MFATGGSVVKNPCPPVQEQRKTRVLIPRLGRSLGKGNGNPLQYSCLENHMDRGAWWATAHGVAKNQTRLNMHVTFAERIGILWERTKEVMCRHVKVT